MRTRVLLPLVAVAGLMAGCGDDDGSLFGDVDEASDEPDDTDDEPGTTDESETTTAPVDVTTGEPTTDDTSDSPFDDDVTDFTFPTLPDNGGSGSRDPGDVNENIIIDEIGRAFAEDDMFTEEQGRCIGQTLYDEVGEDELIEMGSADPSDWPEPVMGTLMDAMWDCIDFRSMMVDEMTGEGAPPAAAECVFDTFSDDEWKQFLLQATISGDTSEFEAEIESAAMDCMGGLESFAR